MSGAEGAVAAETAHKLHAALGTWARPPDDPAKVVLAMAVIALLLALTGRGRSLLGLGPEPLPPKLFLWIASFAAALLSIFYIAHYLRGGPRIVDATTYFLQGRALSHGDFAWPVMEPTGSFRGRFLFFREDAGGAGVMGGIFPPGYPLLLAFGFGFGAPMVVGPAIAAAVVLATYRLARTIAEDALGAQTSRMRAAPSELVEPVARIAALLSVLCGAMRYHTADTMSHGAAALGVALVLDAALRRRAVIAGLVIGAVIATRPVTGAAVGVVALGLLLRGRPGASRARTFVHVALAALPGVLLLLLAQHAVTGAWLTSSQRMYYAVGDGPPECFRWGFGNGVGCVHEHGDFVAARLGKGFGFVEAAGTTLRRLRLHLLDVANLEPLALLVLATLARARGAATRSPAVLGAFAVIALHVLAYVPFYFDGNYPGGGARLLADLLPIEHALLALGVARLAPAKRYPRAGFALLAAALGGFAVHAAHEHGKLTVRDGGRPMFEPDLLARASITSGLVFVDTDHAFALGYDPEARVKNGVVVARLRGDDRDRMLFEQLGNPPTYLYKFEIPPAVAGAEPAQAAPVVVPWAPPAMGEALRFEAEAEWPVIAQSAGFAVPAFTDACASGSRALVLTPSPLAGRASATTKLPVPVAGRYSVAVRVVQGAKVPSVVTRGAALPKGTLRIGGETWDWADVEGAACADLAVRAMLLQGPTVTVVLEAEGGAVALDRVTLRRLP